jgi:hypothetical protein
MTYMLSIEIPVAHSYSDIQAILSEIKKQLVKEQKSIKSLSALEPVFESEYLDADVRIQQLSVEPEKKYKRTKSP